MIMRNCLKAVLALIWATLPVHAQVLMLDFGPTVATGAALTNSPYHRVNPSFTDTVWNTLGTADVPSGLLWSNGDSAAGITLNLGATNNNTSTTLNWSLTPSESGALGGAVNTDIYAGTSVGTDGIWTSSTTSATRAVGVQIGGLSAGTYDVYIMGRNTNTASSTQTFYAIGTASPANLDFSVLTGTTISYTASTPTANWTEGSNYVKFTLTLAADQYLDLVSFGSGSGRGFINAIQIVAVPEPSAGILIVTGLCAMLGLRRPRGRSNLRRK